MPDFMGNSEEFKEMFRGEWGKPEKGPWMEWQQPTSTYITTVPLTCADKTCTKTFIPSISIARSTAEPGSDADGKHAKVYTSVIGAPGTMTIVPETTMTRNAISAHQPTATGTTDLTKTQHENNDTGHESTSITGKFSHHDHHLSPEESHKAKDSQLSHHDDYMLYRLAALHKDEFAHYLVTQEHGKHKNHAATTHAAAVVTQEHGKHNTHAATTNAAAVVGSVKHSSVKHKTHATTTRMVAVVHTHSAVKHTTHATTANTAAVVVDVKNSSTKHTTPARVTPSKSSSKHGAKHTPKPNQHLLDSDDVSESLASHASSTEEQSMTILRTPSYVGGSARPSRSAHRSRSSHYGMPSSPTKTIAIDGPTITYARPTIVYPAETSTSLVPIVMPTVVYSGATSYIPIAVPTTIYSEQPVTLHDSVTSYIPVAVLTTITIEDEHTTTLHSTYFEPTTVTVSEPCHTCPSGMTVYTSTSAYVSVSSSITTPTPPPTTSGLHYVTQTWYSTVTQTITDCHECQDRPQISKVTKTICSTYTLPWPPSAAASELRTMHKAKKHRA
jgi:hypothetical protein